MLREGKEVGRRRWGRVLAFSSGIFLSVVSFFPFLSFSPLAPWMETRLSRLSGDRQYGPDNGLQSEWWSGGERESKNKRERERGRPGRGHRGRQGQNGALVCRARTLYSITLLSLSLLRHTQSLFPQTDTHSPL